MGEFWPGPTLLPSSEATTVPLLLHSHTRASRLDVEVMLTVTRSPAVNW